MPKYGTHYYVLAQATRDLAGSGSANAGAAAEDLNENRGMGMLGSIGPDLFFWAPDYEVVDKLYKLYTNIDRLVTIYNDVMEPIREVGGAVGEPVEAAVETLAPSTVDLIRQLVRRARDTASLFQTTLATGLFSGVIQGFNVMTDLADLPSLSELFFNQFRPHLQSNRPESEWYWFDMLHYRRTGTFAGALVANASSPTQRAYAYGYLSHVATDVVGHAYVNQVVGGPYRLHVQRHVTVENFMDAWTFNAHYGRSVNAALLGMLELPEPSQLPGDVVQLLDSALRQAYQGVQPRRLAGDGFLTAGQIRQTYESLHLVLDVMTRMYVTPPDEPFSGVADVLAAAFEDLLEPPPSPPPAPSQTCSWEDILSFGLTSSSRDCYDEFFEELGEWMEYLGELLVWLAETMLDLFDLILATLLAIPITVLLALLYGIQLLLYDLYQSARSVLALHGFVFPEPDDLNSSHGQFLCTPAQTCAPMFKYPVWKSATASHLACPSRAIEDPATLADFFNPSVATTPDSFIAGLPLDRSDLFAYANSPSPVETRRLEREGRRIGGAVELTAWMIGTATDPDATDADRTVAFTDWNLDSDRGYGYKTWAGTVVPLSPNVSPKVDPEDYV